MSSPALRSVDLRRCYGGWGLVEQVVEGEWRPATSRELCCAGMGGVQAWGC